MIEAPAGGTDAAPTRMPRIGVAISGRGHRAALFGLGALFYLVDAGRNRDVTSIASVSGGSIVNGVVAHAGRFEQMDRASFEPTARMLAGVLAQRGTVLPPGGLTLMYLIGLGILLLGTVVGVWFLPLPLGLRVGGFMAGLLLAGYVAGLRDEVAARALASRLFAPDGKPPLLAAVAGAVDHVISTTDLHAGENVYFSGRFVVSHRLGWGTPGDLPLHVVVQASAGTPGPFPPRWLPVARHSFHDPQSEALHAKRMVLVDGGVTDSMGDRWTLGMPGRRERFARHMGAVHDIDELVVLTSSTALWWGGARRMRVPLIGELLALGRGTAVLYENGDAIRRKLLSARFRAAERSGRGLRGALVHISQIPLEVPRAHVKSAKHADRAQAAIRLLEPDEGRWTALAERCDRAKTSLGRMGTDATADLMEHGYVLAMANLHVLLDYPLLPLPPRSWFESLAS